MEDQISVRAAVPPRLVGLQTRRRVGGAARGLAVADVNDSPIVEISASRPVSLHDVVVAVFWRQQGNFSRLKKTGGGGPPAPSPPPPNPPGPDRPEILWEIPAGGPPPPARIRPP